MSKRTDEQAFQKARKTFLAHRGCFLKQIAATTDPSSRLALEIQYHQETLSKYRQIFLDRVLADPSRRDELIRIFEGDTSGERLWLTAKSKRKEAIRLGKLIRALTPRPQRLSRRERQRQKKEAATRKNRLKKRGLMHW
jgi:hypothetical protein